MSIKIWAWWKCDPVSSETQLTTAGRNKELVAGELQKKLWQGDDIWMIGEINIQKGIVTVKERSLLWQEELSPSVWIFWVVDIQRYP